MPLIIPDYQSLMLPVLQAAAMGEQRIGALVQQLGDQLGLSEAARATLLASGRQTVFANRVHWAKTYLAKAGLVENTRRGHFRITPRGTEILATKPAQIDNRLLSRFEEFRQFTDRAAQPLNEEAVSDVAEAAQQTPDEIMVPPLTLLAAAHLWDLISPRGRAPVPVDQCYMHAWHRHRHTLGASQLQASSPTIGWPAYLNRGLEIPAPG
jgi:restriction system protein